ncbi:MAG TPA: hypothetical protein VMU61_14060 [Candidatus Aquilonibacter sp.]|nr:hypothetical protein [Candidatus Aquilonibacter sp.]
MGKMLIAGLDEKGFLALITEDSSAGWEVCRDAMVSVCLVD